MTLYAFDAIDDAFSATKAFLWPFDLGRWAKLALVAFFLGGVGGFNPFQYNLGGAGGGAPGTPDGPGAPGVPDVIPEVGGLELAIVAAIVGAAVLVGLLFLLVGSIMEFVFVESLRRESVTVRRYWGERWGQGVRLFAFRIVLGVLTFGIVGVVLAAALAPVLFWGGGLSLGLVLVAIPIVVVVAVLSGLVHGFTTVFVVPVMIVEGRGLLDAWRRFWPTMAGQWKQYAVYAIMGFVLQLAGGIVAGLAVLVALIAVAIPLGIVGVVGYVLLQTSGIAGGIVLGVAAVLFVLAAIVVFLFVAVPIQTFLRYYALFVLGDTNEAFDLIAERRRAVREDEAGASGAAG